MTKMEVLQIRVVEENIVWTQEQKSFFTVFLDFLVDMSL